MGSFRYRKLQREGETDWRGSEERKEPEVEQTPECESRDQHGKLASGTEPWPRRGGRPGSEEDVEVTKRHPTLSPCPLAWSRNGRVRTEL